MWAANDTPIRISGEIRLPFCIDDCCFWTDALVSEDIEEVMLGSDWLQDHGCVWDFRTGNLSIDGIPAVTLTRRSYLKCRRIFVQEHQEIPPRSHKDITVRRTLLSTDDVAENVIVETHQLKPGLYVGRTLLPPKLEG